MHQIMHCNIRVTQYGDYGNVQTKGTDWHMHAVECYAAVNKGEELAGKDFHSILVNENTEAQTSIQSVRKKGK